MNSENIRKQHRSARSILAARNAERKKDATALAELIYDVYKEKKRSENGKIVMDQNNAQFNSSN
jgi:16S rRNA C1402 N4-methylase RsmH